MTTINSYSYADFRTQSAKLLRCHAEYINLLTDATILACQAEVDGQVEVLKEAPSLAEIQLRELAYHEADARYKHIGSALTAGALVAETKP